MFNKIIIQGNVTRDPETITTSGGTKIVKFGLAWNESRSDDAEPHFYNVSVMGRTADFVEQYVKKGSGVIVEGQLRNNRWTTDDGQKRSTYEIFVGFTGSVNFTSSGRRNEEEGETGTVNVATGGEAGGGEDLF